MLSQFHAFVRQKDGSIAILFGLIVFVLCGTVALGLDYARALAVRTKLQWSVDAAALGARATDLSDSATLQARVTDLFNYNNKGANNGAINITVSSTTITNGVRVEAQATVPTSFGRLLGVNSLPVSVKAEAVSANGNFEIALVLDNTGSMMGTKIDDLKSASKDLVDTVSTAVTAGGGGVKFGLVPFSQYVNVGTANRSSTWMSVPNDYSENYNSCYTTTDWDGCPTVSTPSTCYNDGVPYSCASVTCATPGPSRSVCSSGTITHTWYGCAGSRTPAPDTAVVANMSKPVPGVLDTSCPAQLTRLTSDTGTIKTQIDGMVATGETYIASGLMWGWRVLSPTEPFNDGVAAGGAVPTKKAMILMTDGANTMSQLDTTHSGYDVTASNTAMDQLCTNIKAQNIELYTVSFTVTDPAVKDRMISCATDAAHYFDSADGAALKTAFERIAGALTKLSLSR